MIEISQQSSRAQNEQPMPVNPSPESTQLAEQVLRHIHTVLIDPKAVEQPLPEALAGLEKMEEVHALLWGLRHLAESLAKGELDYSCLERGYVVGGLKSLQANLRHLTWQAQRIAEGDFNHKVSFLGDFSAAFNKMTSQLDGIINTLTNISEKYKDLSHRDALTGLNNRLGFFKSAEALMLQHPDMVFSLAIADIDHFKEFNDTYGHLCGDDVLRQVAQTLLLGLRDTDICCRWGGEEFLILMPRTPLSEGVHVSERMRQDVAEMSVDSPEGESLHVTVSLGIVEIPCLLSSEPLMTQLNQWIQLADAHLYCAKTAGRNLISSDLDRQVCSVASKTCSV